jgi:hypothetical protein
MNSFQHFIPAPNLTYPARFERGYTGESSLPFMLSLTLADTLEGKHRADYMSRLAFPSLPIYGAFIGAGWADVYAHRDRRT